MTDFVFRMSPNVILGAYAISRLGYLVSDWGTRFLIVVDPILNEFKLSEKIIQGLTERKIESFTFSDFTDGVSTKTVQRTLKLAKEGHIHGVIAVGGQKAMNIGRLVAAFCNEELDLYSFVDGALPKLPSLPCICVPTVFKSPFVFTHQVPIFDSRKNQLKLLNVQPNVCRLMLVDPNMTLTLTDNQRSAMALEVLCHATEAYISQKENFFSDMFVEKAVELMGYALDGTQSVEVTSPQEILFAQSGVMTSIATGASSLGVASLLAIAINARFKISKSLVTTILFPYVIEDAAKFKADRLAKIAHFFRVVSNDVSAEEATRAYAENIRQRIAKANLPARLKDLQLSMDKLALAVEDASKIEIANMLPRSMTVDALFDFVKLAY